MKKNVLYQENPVNNFCVCPVNKLTLQDLESPLYPTPWRNYKYLSSQTPIVQISSTARVQELDNQIEKIKKRYSKSINKGRKLVYDEKEQNAYDSKFMEKKFLNGSRLIFKDDLSMDLYDVGQKPTQLPLIAESVQVGSITISKEIALPKYLEKPRHRSVNHKKIPEYSIRRFSHIDDQVERVRLQQVDILKKYHVKNFSKDIQSKLKDELFIILKKFQ